MSNIRAIDADGHITEMTTDWAPRFPAEYRDRAPRLIRDENDNSQILLDGYRFPDPSYEGKGRWASRLVEIQAAKAGMVDPRKRLPDMDVEGIDLAVVYGTTYSFHANSLTDAKLSTVYAQVWNDWADEYCSADPSRLRFAAIVPLVDINASVKEAERIVKKGRAAGIMVGPNFGGMALDHPYFDPLYAAARDLNVPICVHASVGSQRNIQGHGVHDNWFITHAIAFPFGIIHAVASVVCGGVYERFPGLRVGFFEGGCGWLPFFAERLDEHHEKVGRLVPWLKRKPSEYIKSEQFFLSCEPEEPLAHVLEEIGEGRVMYASDYAHWDCEYPNSVRKISERTELTETQKRRVLRDNAIDFYGLKVPATV